MTGLISIDKLIADIIPPDDYQHRNGFSNTHLVDKLNGQERELLEESLINSLSNNVDILIVETLAYMKSSKSLPIFMDLLEHSFDDMCKIIIATSVFEINHDNRMIVICIDAFEHLSNVYQKISAFYYLQKFQNEATDAIIEEYTKHSDYLLSYNAKQALNK